MNFKFVLVFQTGSYDLHSATINSELIEKIERMTKLIEFILVKCGNASAIFSPLLITFTNYFILNMGSQSFRFDGRFWLPFDPNTPIGFFSATLFQCIAVCPTIFSFTPIVCLLIGSCWSIVTFLKDVARDISLLRKRELLNLSKQKLSERFCNFIRFHAEVEEFSVHCSLHSFCNAMKCEHEIKMNPLLQISRWI